MQPIGERLEEARKRKGVSLREAAEATKIRSDYLHKFESNQFDLNLPEIYVRGFLRNYAGFLKLSPDKIAADYDELDYGETRSAPRMPSREVYGRMDLSVASAHSSSEGKASAPIETPSPEPAPTPRRLPQTFRGSPPAPGTQINIDQVAKFIARAAIVVVVLGLVVWGIKSLVVGGHQQKPAAVVEPVAAQPLPEQTITLVALGPLDVQVKQEIDGKIIYRGTLAAGQRVPIVKRGAVFITYTSGRNLQVEINGRLYGMPTPGYDRARIE